MNAVLGTVVEYNIHFLSYDVDVDICRCVKKSPNRPHSSVMLRCTENLLHPLSLLILIFPFTDLFNIHMQSTIILAGHHPSDEDEEKMLQISLRNHPFQGGLFLQTLFPPFITWSLIFEANTHSWGVQNASFSSHVSTMAQISCNTASAFSIFSKTIG